MQFTNRTGKVPSFRQPAYKQSSIAKQRLLRGSAPYQYIQLIDDSSLISFLIMIDVYLS